MQTSVSPILLVAMLAGILALVALVIAFRMRPTRQSRVAVAAAALPALLMLALFYSLAIHMRQSLGAWPTSIGERGFPPLLVTHATITVDFFMAVLLASISVFPVAIVVCLLVQRWRRCVPYLALYVAMFFVCW